MSHYFISSGAQYGGGSVNYDGLVKQQRDASGKSESELAGQQRRATLEPLVGEMNSFLFHQYEGGLLAQQAEMNLRMMEGMLNANRYAPRIRIVAQSIDGPTVVEWPSGKRERVPKKSLSLF